MNPLVNNLNSDYIGAINALSSKKSKRIIKVYVESDQDVSFWNNFFNSFNLSNVSFVISLPNKTSYETGKRNVLRYFKESIGENLILCLDSDYDYLIPDYDEDSNLINKSSFIFHTYAYSIENHYCYHKSLLNYSIQCLKKSDLKIDVGSLLTSYSTIIYDLLVWNIFLYSKKLQHEFSITDFVECCKILIVDDFENKFQTSFECLQERVSVKINELETRLTNFYGEKEEFKKYLTSKKLLPENCYIFSNGHLIMENVVLMFLKAIIKSEKQIKLDEIRSKCKHDIQVKDEERKYRKLIIENKSVEQNIYTNYNFQKSYEYQKLWKNFQQFVVTYNL